ncbi:hypothetical protein NQ314_000585, partial [Rhamnusium bicolor]
MPTTDTANNKEFDDIDDYAKYKSTDVEEWNEVINEEEGDTINSQEESDASENKENEPPVIKIMRVTTIGSLDTTIEWSKQNTIAISDIISLKKIYKKI